MASHCQYIEYEFIQGKRKGSTILHSISESQLYGINKKLKNGSVSYRCTFSNCKAAVQLSDGKCSLKTPFAGHLHPSRTEEIRDMVLLNNIKNAVATQPMLASQTSSQISEIRETFDRFVLT